MRHFPAFLDLRGRTVLLLGHGEVAARKAEPLRRAGALIRQADAFAPGLLEGVVLAVGADAPEAELQALSQAAQARGIPVNVVDRPALCSFITPAIIDRDPVTIAIGTGGAAPVLARMIRQRIEAMLPPGIGGLAALAERFQQAVRARLPDLPARRRFLDAALTGAPAALALEGREAEAEAAFARALAAAETTPPGIVHLVDAGPGEPDLLTLRALRLMGEADVILHDARVPAPVLEMARRDAERIALPAAAADGVALMIGLAQQGRRVVRLHAGDGAAAGREAAALRQAGVTHAMVPGVAFPAAS
jgi:uroporphyrin-III C-methyltransferase/precorrin-2 dehydrogenase/sirohydrochlorin ferrochelatase